MNKQSNEHQRPTHCIFVFCNDVDCLVTEQHFKPQVIDRERDQATKNQMENDNNNMNVSEKRNHFVYLTISVIVCRA